jgi:hypothetical protein
MVIKTVAIYVFLDELFKFMHHKEPILTKNKIPPKSL